MNKRETIKKGLAFLVVSGLTAAGVALGHSEITRNSKPPLSEIIKNPEKYEGKPIKVDGYYKETTPRGNKLLRDERLEFDYINTLHTAPSEESSGFEFRESVFLEREDPKVAEILKGVPEDNPFKLIRIIGYIVKDQETNRYFIDVEKKGKIE